MIYDRVIKVSNEGVSFGNCWISHEAILGLLRGPITRKQYVNWAGLAESPKGDQHVVEPAEEHASDETEENPSQPDVHNQASGLTSPCLEQQADSLPGQPMPKASPATSWSSWPLGCPAYPIDGDEWRDTKKGLWYKYATGWTLMD